MQFFPELLTKLDTDVKVLIYTQNKRIIIIIRKKGNQTGGPSAHRLRLDLHDPVGRIYSNIELFQRVRSLANSIIYK